MVKIIARKRKVEKTVIVQENPIVTEQPVALENNATPDVVTTPKTTIHTLLKQAPESNMVTNKEYSVWLAHVKHFFGVADDTDQVIIAENP